jgi:hypothetical protein
MAVVTAAALGRFVSAGGSRPSVAGLEPFEVLELSVGFLFGDDDE